MTDKETAAELLMHLGLHQAVASEIALHFGDAAAATHISMAQAYARELLELGVDPRLLEYTEVIH